MIGPFQGLVHWRVSISSPDSIPGLHPGLVIGPFQGLVVRSPFPERNWGCGTADRKKLPIKFDQWLGFYEFSRLNEKMAGSVSDGLGKPA
jgi:hypothetical protein